MLRRYNVDPQIAGFDVDLAFNRIDDLPRSFQRICQQAQSFGSRQPHREATFTGQFVGVDDRRREHIARLTLPFEVLSSAPPFG